MTTADASDAVMLLNAAQATLMGETVECQRCRRTIVVDIDASDATIDAARRCQCQCWSHLFSRGPLPGFLGPGGGGFGQALGESTPVVAQDQRTLEAEQNKVSSIAAQEKKEEGEDNMCESQDSFAVSQFRTPSRGSPRFWAGNDDGDDDEEELEPSAKKPKVVDDGDGGEDPASGP